MDIKNTAKAFMLECNKSNRCKECLYKTYCENLFKDEVPCRLGLQQVEYILYNQIFGCIDVATEMNKFKGEN